MQDGRMKHCPKCQKELDCDVTLEYKIYKCQCGYRTITDYAGKEIDTKTKMMLEEIYNTQEIL